jgi:hypothetical protein
VSNKFRIYIDESGTHSYSVSTDITKRFLGLTGIIVDAETYETEVQPRIIKLKKIFSPDPDDLPILHREDIIDKTGAFTKLNDPLVQAEFNTQLMSLLTGVDYCVCCVVINKTEHFAKYQKSANHPYHYCLTTMLERYVHYLSTRGRGDVMVESREKVEDTALKGAYQYFYNYGTYFLTSRHIQTHLSSQEIKVKPKTKGVEGLEFADLLALPTKLDVLKEYGVLSSLTVNFTKQIIDAIQPKYCRWNADGRIKGCGKKLL